MNSNNHHHQRKGFPFLHHHRGHHNHPYRREPVRRQTHGWFIAIGAAVLVLAILRERVVTVGAAGA